MKKFVSILLSSAMCLSLCCCGSSVTQEQYDALTAENSQLESQIAKYEKYSEIIDCLEAEDYDSAVSCIEEEQEAKLQAEAGDMADYLVTVELTTENFSDYFEFQIDYLRDAFGEIQTELNSDTGLVTLASKVYDNGYIYYDSDCAFEYEIKCSSPYWYSETNTKTLEESIGGPLDSVSQYATDATFTVTRVEGTVTFIKSDYILSYDVGEITNIEFQTAAAAITLKNGDKLWHYVYFGHLY